MNSGTHQFGRRTNSLAFSKYDCHTCVELNKHCDRRRPCCGPCENSKRRCGGFALDLVWKQPPRLSRCENTVDGAICDSSNSCLQEQHNFKFVRGRPAKKRRKAHLGNGVAPAIHVSKFRLDKYEKPLASPSSSTDSPQPDFTTASAAQLEGTEDNRREDSLFDWDQVQPPGFALSLWPMAAISSAHNPAQTVDLAQPFQHASHALQNFELPQTTDIFLDALPHIDSQITQTDADGCADISTVVCSSNSLEQMRDPNHNWSGPADILDDLPPEVKFRSLAQKYSSMFTMFNEEFCVVPLSTDCRHNPFRARSDFAESFPFLLHAVMAIASHHLARKYNSAALQRESFDHWSTAVQSFSVSLSCAGFFPLLDTILILINFESTQSVYGMLDMHLGGARTLLQQAGAIQKFHKSSRLRSQLAMLTWWDVTSSLIARRKPRFANTYLRLLSEYNEADGWSFITLNGCPTSFIVAMGHLSELAEAYVSRGYGSESEQTQINRLLEEVKSFGLEDEMELEGIDEDATDPDEIQNRKHCVEAWRHAILLYACRVFTVKQDLEGLRNIKHHARIILDSARCIPPAEPFQKQLLLPVFLAGAEVGDEFNRSFIRHYCQHWSSTSNFDQFSGAEALLKDFWNEWSPWTRDTYWWGIRIGGTLEADKQSLTKQLLLG